MAKYGFHFFSIGWLPLWDMSQKRKPMYTGRFYPLAACIVEVYPKVISQNAQGP